VFIFHDFRFEILGRQRNQITSIKVTPPDDGDWTSADTGKDAAAQNQA
jgi:Mg2+/Co2+ transporter CorB